MRHLLILSVLIVLTFDLTGCAAARRGVAALRSTSDFKALESDRRVLYEPGSEEFAREVAGYLPDAVATVEREQYLPFTKPVRVYVCSTNKSFARHTGFEARGALTVKLFLSAEGIKNIQDGNSAKGLLTHELSHLHFQNRRGVWGYGGIPSWFTEGLAVEASGGAPAFDVSEAQAAEAILSGKHIKPETTGSILFPKLGASYGLKPHMFYRQSAMFVKYLKHTDEAKFREFMLLIENGRNFEDSFKAIYGVSVQKTWEGFVCRLGADAHNKEEIDKRL